MIRRQNDLDTSAWHQVMDSLEAVTSVTSLNGLNSVGGLFAGSQMEVQLGGKGLGEREAVVAVARLLVRSRGTLIRLDLRCYIRLHRANLGIADPSFHPIDPFSTVKTA
jgi:hypothetical protein